MADVEHKTVIDGGMHLQHTGDMGRMGVRGAWERHYSRWHARDRLSEQERHRHMGAWVHGAHGKGTTAGGMQETGCQGRRTWAHGVHGCMDALWGHTRNTARNRDNRASYSTFVYCVRCRESMRCRAPAAESLELAYSTPIQAPAPATHPARTSFSPAFQTIAT